MGSITILPYQPIKFKNADEPEVSCGCNIQSYCQIVAPTDPTQFQIRSSNDVFNGNFEDEWDGWVTNPPFYLNVDPTNATDLDCDGEVAVNVVDAELITYSISLNGGTPVDVIGGGVVTFTDLCVGCYFVTATDPNGNQSSYEFCIVENVDCSLFDGATLQDVIDSEETLIEFYNCTLNDLKP